MLHRLILLSCVLMAGFGAGAEMSPAQCAREIQKCEIARAKIYAVEVAWSAYKSCLMPKVPVTGGCKRELADYVRVWNEFVDNCIHCASNESPLKSCVLYDQTAVCPPKLIIPKKEA